MSDAAEAKIADLEERLANTQREYFACQEMLAGVLAAVGEPVEVTKEILLSLGSNDQIRVDDNMEKEAFVFSLEKVNEQ